MPRNDAVIITVRDAIHTGMALGLGQTATLKLWRELGGVIRDTEFSTLWTGEKEAFAAWRRKSTQS